MRSWSRQLKYHSVDDCQDATSSQVLSSIMVLPDGNAFTTTLAMPVGELLKRRCRVSTLISAPPCGAPSNFERVESFNCAVTDDPSKVIVTCSSLVAMWSSARTNAAFRATITVTARPLYRHDRCNVPNRDIYERMLRNQSRSFAIPGSTTLLRIHDCEEKSSLFTTLLHC